MQILPQSVSLAGRRGIVLGIANEASIAWGCARATHNAGAQLALTYFNDKAKQHVPLPAQDIESPLRPGVQFAGSPKEVTGHGSR